MKIYLIYIAYGYGEIDNLMCVSNLDIVNYFMWVFEMCDPHDYRYMDSTQYEFEEFEVIDL